jgi:hypothetical protein
VTYRVSRVQPLDLPTDVIVVHVQRLKPYTGMVSLPPLPDEVDEARVKAMPQKIRDFYGRSTEDGRISKEGSTVKKP